MFGRFSISRLQSIMNAPGIAFLLLITAHIAPLDVRAQQLRVAPGVRVRLTLLSEGSYRPVGTITEIGDNGLMLEVQGLPTPMELLFTSVSKLEISIRAANRGSRFVKGAGIGLVAGAALGAVIGFADGDDELECVPPEFPLFCFGFSAEEKALALGVVLGAAGAVIGGVIGAASGGERWAEVTEPFTDLGFGILPLRHGGLSLTLSRRF